ncbi:hypothetical protein JTB14_006968 [Gonioctena quinquepunctata]|nr:hypothetical protein JTB14_006968 [Gonioctena quinquepunctata]
MERHRLVDLETMDTEELYDFIDGISEKQAVDSDVGGDSDADDQLVHEERPQKVIRSRASGSNKELEVFDDFGSDDSENDPDYIPEDSENTPLSIVRRRLMYQRYAADIDSDSEIDDSQNNGRTDESNDQPLTNKPFSMQWSKNAHAPTKYENYSFNENFDGNEDIIQRIVNESQIYAQQRGVTFDTTIGEMKPFFGFFIIMGFHNLPSIRLYWSTDQNMRVSRIANTISLKRFPPILRYLHINNIENAPKKGDPNFDKLYKLKPMVTHLNQEFKEIFSPARQLSIDERMVGFKGGSSLKQYMPMKPTKRGFKIWVMACAKSGYMLSFKIYEGKGSEDIEGTLGERTVLTLAEDYLNKGYCLFYDNFFFDVSFAE